MMELKEYFDWAVGGVDISLDAVGGDDCINFVPTRQKIIESCIFIPVALLQVFWGWKRIPSLVVKVSAPASHRNALVRSLLLISLVFTFGLEVGFKLASKTMIWIVNPCHVITLLQIVLLSLPPGPWASHLLRCLTNSTNGPIVALLFPAVHTRFLYFEVHTYFLQHWLIVLIPWLLVIMDGESYSLEDLGDWSYAVFSMGITFLYHWIPLQLLSVASGFNLNVICCPSSDDPFYGPNYRIACFTHQTIMCLLTGKLARVCARPLAAVTKAKKS